MNAVATNAAATTATDVLVRENVALVGHLVREMMFKVPAHVHRDDLASAGYAALVAAAQQFDAGRGVAFGKVAAVRVRTALLDALRGAGAGRSAEVARTELVARLGHTPAAAELGALLGLGATEVGATVDVVQHTAVLSLLTNDLGQHTEQQAASRNAGLARRSVYAAQSAPRGADAPALSMAA